MSVNCEVVLSKVLEVTNDQDLAETVANLCSTCATISEVLRNTLVSSMKTTNVFGDEQLSVDAVAEAKMWQCVADPKTHCSFGASEESPELKATGNDAGKYVCFWDPLDGSSIIGCNWSVGTIIAVTTLPTSFEEIKGTPPREHMKASIVAIYGPRVTIVVGLGSVCCEYTLLGAAFHMTNDNVQITPTAVSKKFFAPANLRATNSHTGYNQYVTKCMKEKYTLRYSGGLVPDVYHILCKKSGVFSNPTTEAAPAKLRFLYETAPLSHIVESAGGSSCDAAGTVLLDMPIIGLDQRTSLVCGAKYEVETCLTCINN
eukprot:Protomagalhaensia_sp_Gyna_25__1602@NODE_1828_length_1495_cov_871_514423_g1503_i0_p1_GENE_NODE_1828_length_1495_cov_871_514423_g1503_i0NODE_1828_length_1495_cov_871_514423_g1503_i0_p1_ORF_typecomplete_len316_score53_31FBPase/PF00316_20/1_4e31Inositol_P/PF00459_25/3Inositol_P/PF00459_25/11_NODE_1828_length_1495_cov_871_514423_g1503_i04871434